MQVFKLEIDCAKCCWIGMAIVAAESYDAAVDEYIMRGESGIFVANGEIAFTEDSKIPIEGLTYHTTKVLCEVTTFES